MTNNDNLNKYAYVTVMYGNNIYLTGALVLGHTLLKTNPFCDRVILVTPDVSPEYRSYVGRFYNKVISIEYTQVSNEIFSDQNTRFRDVFTKLECLDLIQYDKVILLDLDMIITKNIDHLFQLDAPAACLKRYYVPYGKKIPANMICQNDKLVKLVKLVGSINAGLMLLKPDKAEWSDIKTDINKDTQLAKYKYPEQDYLSLRYCGKWTSITFNYNYQFGLTFRVKKYRYRLDDIYVIHYSSSYKPWSDLLPNRTISPDESEFKTVHKKYYDLWHNTYDHIKSKFADDGITLPY